MVLYKDVLISAVPNIMQSTIRELISNKTDAYFAHPSPCPGQPFILHDTDYIDFRRFAPLLHIVNSVVSNRDGETLNRIIDLVVTREGFVDIGGGDLLNVNQHVDELHGDVHVRLSGLSITGLDTTYDVEVLDPTDQLGGLRNGLYVGRGTPVTISIDVELNIAGEINDAFTIYLDIQDTGFAGDVILQMKEANVFPLHMNELLSLPCLINTIQDAGFSNGVGALGQVHIRVKCTKCHSPLMVLLNDSLNSEDGHDKLQSLVKVQC